jgi:amidase
MPQNAAGSWSVPFPEVEERSIADYQAEMAAGRLTARTLVSKYLARIEATNRQGPCLNAVLELAPDVLTLADALDRERAATGARSALHGIPILLKDNIASADGTATTAGSLALLGTRPQGAFVVQRLRAAGAIVLGKANMSEWANFRSTRSSSGWSGRGGQGVNPYGLDLSPCGSSSGSASAVAANLAAAALGTETDGSILCPAGVNGVVGIKPTVGLTSRSGVVPLAHSQDTVGPLTRSVADAAILLGIMAGPDPRDPAAAEAARFAVADYTACLDADGLRGARIGIPREVYWGYSEKADAIAESAVAVMRDLGAVVVDPANIPTAADMARGWPPSDNSALTVLLYEFKADINAYLSALGPDAPVRTLDDLIAFNERHRDREMPYFGQELFLQANAKGPLTDPIYLAALERNHRLSRQQGIDAVMDAHELDALVMPTTNPAWKIDLVNGARGLGSSARAAALAGYPAISVPAGHVFGLPVGITFLGRAGAEPTLIRLSYAFEQAARARQAPRMPAPSVLPPG